MKFSVLVAMAVERNTIPTAIIKNIYYMNVLIEWQVKLPLYDYYLEFVDVSRCFESIKGSG